MSRATLSRRTFLQQAAAVAAAPALFDILPSGVFGEEGKPPPSEKLHIAGVGVGGQGLVDLRGLENDHHVVALCDVDERNAAKAFERWPKAQRYTDFRKMLETQKDIDAVVIATPDHWHALIATAALQAGKHVYCEKPLTHAIGEARRLRELARQSKTVTQMGNQGSASANLRRNLEVIQGGLLGQVREVHIWHPEYSSKSCGHERPKGEEPVPPYLNWDFWVGPAAMRPFLRGLYHPFAWRYWWDFGNGSLGDFCGHAFNLPVRALRLGHPAAIDVSGKGLNPETYVNTCHVLYRFAARGELAPVELHFHHGELPPDAATQGFADTFGKVPQTGCVLMGERGTISAGLWNADGYLRMKDEKKFKGVTNHEAAKAIPQTLPRARGHMDEFLSACRGAGKTFSDFDVGGLVTEIGLTGALALRLGKRIEWDGEAMKVAGCPEANPLIQPEYRKPWAL